MGGVTTTPDTVYRSGDFPETNSGSVGHFTADYFKVNNKLSGAIEDFVIDIGIDGLKVFDRQWIYNTTPSFLPVNHFDRKSFHYFLQVAQQIISHQDRV